MLDMRALVAEHSKLPLRGADPELHAFGLFKSLRNFLHPLLKSRTEPTIGIDYRPAVEEALGDMLMYLCSLHRALGVEPQEYVPPQKCLPTAESAARMLIDSFAKVAAEPRGGWLVGALAAVLGACEVCCVDPSAAASKSLAKMRRKFGG